MKKIIVISDSHGNAKGVSALLPLVAENDYVIHLFHRQNIIFGVF